MAVSALEAAFPDRALAEALGVVDGVGPAVLASVRAQSRRGERAAPRTTSCARLLDAVAAILGLARSSGYDGEPARRLDALARRALGPGESAFAAEGAVTRTSPSSPTSDDAMHAAIPLAIIDTLPLIRGVVRERLMGRDPGHIALAFLHALAGRVGDAASRLSRFTGVTTVALSGNATVHRILLESLKHRLESDGLSVLVAERIPATDAGLAVGQAAVACARLATLAGGSQLGDMAT